MSKNAKPHEHPSKTRVVRYTFVAARPEEPSIHEGEIELVLSTAKLRGVITEYDTGRGRDPWFEGPPGRALVAIRYRMFEVIARERERMGLPPVY
jgi:hypothetical protein